MAIPRIINIIPRRTLTASQILAIIEEAEYTRSIKITESKHKSQKIQITNRSVDKEELVQKLNTARYKMELFQH